MEGIRTIICTFDYGEEGFEHLLARLDLLHDLASEGRLVEATPLRASDVVGWLEDIIFTAEETIREIDAHTPAFHAFVDQTQSISQLGISQSVTDSLID
ncbi:MAG: hypothetical protein HY782_20495 [Chloroflexi bacterium]|nr:hypothetical protein [Chloroflexota bacterium]